MRFLTKKLMSVTMVLVATLMLTACPKKPPTLSPVGSTAYNADQLVVANRRALTLLEPLTDQGTIPKTAMQAIVIGSNYVAEGGKSLVAALKACQTTPTNCKDVRDAVTAIRSGLNRGLSLIPAGPAHDRVVLILQPVFDLLLDIFAPAKAGYVECNGAIGDSGPCSKAKWSELAYAR